MSTGKVWLVGAGPYEEGLFTIKGQRVLKQADVVVYDNLVGPGILQMIPEDAKKIDVGKQAGNHKVVQEDINKILLEEALQGKKVVRLKGGDPFLFGRGGEELELLWEHKIPFEVVPGITSAIAVPGYGGIPVTHRDYTSSLHIITAHKKKGSQEKIEFEKLVALGDVTLIFLMGIGELDHICNGLIKAGMAKDMPAAVLEKGTTSKQRRVVATVEALPSKAKEANIGTPGIIMVGKVCELSDKFHWAEDRQLSGLRIYVTRPKEKSSTIADKLTELGAEVIKLPTIETQPTGIEYQWENVQNNLKEYEWIIFTSAVAVEYFFKFLQSIRKDIRTLAHIHFAAVGKATKEAVEQHGVLVDFMPEKYNGEELGQGVSSLVTKGKKVLVFTPKDVKSQCVLALEQEKIVCDTIELYETKIRSNNIISMEKEDWAVFTSASTVKGFANVMEEKDLIGMKAICIGELTGQEASKHGMNVSISREASMESLIDKVIEEYNTEKVQR